MEATAETFVLRNDEPKHTPWAGDKPERRRQGVLFSGMNCLAGQQDLFSTDGERESHR